MKVFTNPNIMNSSKLGIDFGAYNSELDAWMTESTSCYVDNSANATIQKYSCQKYNDHVYDKQYDNTFNSKPNFGVY